MNICGKSTDQVCAKNDRKKYTLYVPTPVLYRKASHDMPETDISTPINTKGKLLVQQIFGSFLYYGRAVNMIILASLREIAGGKSNPTENKMKKVNKFFNYMATNPDAVIQYYASDMIFNFHLDTRYSKASKSRSRACRNVFLGSITFDKDPIVLNGTILTHSTILKFVAASAAEAKLGALFLNTMEVKMLQIT